MSEQGGGGIKREAAEDNGSNNKRPRQLKQREPTLLSRDAHSLSITWPKVEGAEKYRVRFRKDDDLQWQSIGVDLVSNNSLKKKNLETGCTYYFGVQPWINDEVGTGDWSWSSTSAGLVPMDETPNNWRPFYLMQQQDEQQGQGNLNLHLSDILYEEDDAKIDSIYLFNFLASIDTEDKISGWLGDFWGSSESSAKVHLFHGMRKHVDGNDAKVNRPKMTFCPISVTEEKGSHHSKLAIVFYVGRGVRVSVMTGNLRNDEMEKMTNVCWVGDFPLKQIKAEEAQASCAFETDLCEYLAHLFPAMRSNHTRNREAEERLESLVSKLHKYDFSTAEVALIPSVPGRHKSKHDSHEKPAMESLGHMKLNRLLSAEACLPKSFKEGNRCYIDMQVSSISSLGTNEKYLCELARSMRALKGHDEDRAKEGTPSKAKPSKQSQASKQAQALKELEDVHLIWPDVGTISRAKGGYDTGTNVPCLSSVLRESKGDAYKANLKQVLRKWDGTPGGKELNAPHIKSFCRYFVAETDGAVELLWLYLGSANLSQAAWGNSEHDGHQIFCKSYELGVLFLPSRTTRTSRAFSLTPKHKILGCGGGLAAAAAAVPPRFIVSHAACPRDGSRVHFPLPHRVPAPEYLWALPTLDNSPWATDMEVTVKDSEGKVRQGKGLHSFKAANLIENFFH